MKLNQLANNKSALELQSITPKDTEVEIDETMQEVERIEAELGKFDLSGQKALQNQSLHSLERTEPILIIYPTTLQVSFELQFLINLCQVPSTVNAEPIQVCLNLPDMLKSVGYMPLDYDHIHRIHLYQPNLKIGILMPDMNEPVQLTRERELCLP